MKCCEMLLAGQNWMFGHKNILFNPYLYGDIQNVNEQPSKRN